MKNWMWWAVIIIVIISGVWFLSAKKAAAPAMVGGEEEGTMEMGAYPYECDEHVTFTMSPSGDVSTIVISPTGTSTYPPQTTLTKVATSSGALFEGGGLSFFGRGESVTLTEGAQELHCSPVPNPDEAPFNWGD